MNFFLSYTSIDIVLMFHIPASITHAYHIPTCIKNYRKKMIFLKNILHTFTKVYMYIKLKAGGAKPIFKLLTEL